MLRMVPHTVPCVGRSYEHFPDGFELHLLPFRCTTCGKAFPALSKLAAHLRSHTGDCPFKCTVCDKTFSQVFFFFFITLAPTVE